MLGRGSIGGVLSMYVSQWSQMVYVRMRVSRIWQFSAMLPRMLPPIQFS